MASLSAPKSVVIVGGSLAGLMHALILLSLPSPPKVLLLERSPTALLHNQGAGVVAGNEVQEFFTKVVKPGREIAITSRLRHYLQRNGDVIPDSVEHKQQRMTSWDLLYHLMRWRVEGLKSEYVQGLQEDARPKAEYDNGCTVDAIEATDGGIKVSWNKKDVGHQSAIADLVIAADGASSSLRKLVAPEVKREFAGYVAWRGTVPEADLSEQAQEAFFEKFTFYHSEGIQILGYLIPGTNGTTEPGQRLFNWVWYCNYKDGSSELEELMTDTNGSRHKITLPVGTMQEKVWKRQQDYASKVLPPQYAEAISKTKEPFIQAITDNISTKNSFFDGRLLLTGDALAGFRPHTAASTGQAAFDALQLGKWLGGGITKSEYDESVMDFARHLQNVGVQLGQRSQFGKHPLAG